MRQIWYDGLHQMHLLVTGLEKLPVLLSQVEIMIANNLLIGDTEEYVLMPSPTRSSSTQRRQKPRWLLSLGRDWETACLPRLRETSTDEQHSLQGQTKCC